MPDRYTKDLIAEAADIFIRLREHPNDAGILAERDAFLDRGKTERNVYAHVEKAWEGVGRKPGPNKPLGLALAVGLVALGYFAAEPARTFMFADFRTALDTREITLASGDVATLDAATALVDETDGSQRHITLYKGSALFDVDTDGRAFEVLAGDLTIEVLGTTFEAARIGDVVTVSVDEGRVRVSGDAASWLLGAGDSLQWSTHQGGEVSQIEPGAIALWRQNRFVADGLTFAQVASVIDRRLPGTVVVTNSDLANSRVSGTIDLENPERALEALALTRGARLVSVPLLGYLIRP